MKEKVTVAVVGATGAVGREMVSILEERALPVQELVPLASERSEGEELEFHGTYLKVKKLTADSFNGVDIALFSAGGAISAEFGPIAAQAGAIVIDNSSHFRMMPDIPLIVPEVNADEIRARIRARKNGAGMIIANPNCSTIQLTVALKPIEDRAGIKRVVVSTYQSVSGAGKKGMDELWNQTISVFNQGEIKKSKFPHQIAFNCIPHIDTFVENDYTKEEMKVVNETRKIMGLPSLAITVTAVRVPVFVCHSESVNVETKRALSPDEARELLRASPGIMVVDSPSENSYPIGLEVGGTDATFVGRIRRDESVEHGLNMWVVADNLRKGAALNAVQIAEIALEKPH